MEMIDKIRAEIERRLSWRITLEARAAYNNILRFLDTLPEQPASEGLEEEISSYWNRVTGFQPKFAVLELTKEELAKVARHFAEWGAKNAKQ